MAVNPVYQGLGLGKELMKYILKELKNIGISKVTLFADANVVSFYKRQGWILEPRGLLVLISNLVFCKMKPR